MARLIVEVENGGWIQYLENAAGEEFNRAHAAAGKAGNAEMVVLCDFVWKPRHAKRGETCPAVCIGLGGRFLSRAAIR